MGATKNDNRNLISRIAADLLSGAGSTGGRSLDLGRLRAEILRDVESKAELFGKFRGLLETLRDFVPEEDKLYRAAIKTLSTASGISEKDVLEAADTQLSELKKMDQVLLDGLSAWRDDLKGLESKSLAIRNEMSRYRGIIEQLEKEERELRDGMALRSKEIELAERNMEGLLSGIAAEISGIRAKVEEFTSQRGASRPAATGADAGDDRTAKGESIATEGGVRGESGPRQSDDRKRCSVCGCRAFWYEKEKVWKCYVCAYEEKEETEAADARGEAEPPFEPEGGRAERKPEFPNAGVDSIPSDFSSFHKLTTPRSKTCPICRKKMDWHDSEKSWKCPHCAYHRMEF